MLFRGLPSGPLLLSNVRTAGSIPDPAFIFLNILLLNLLCPVVDSIVGSVPGPLSLLLDIIRMLANLPVLTHCRVTTWPN